MTKKIQNNPFKRLAEQFDIIATYRVPIDLQVAKDELDDQLDCFLDGRPDLDRLLNEPALVLLEILDFLEDLRNNEANIERSCRFTSVLHTVACNPTLFVDYIYLGLKEYKEGIEAKDEQLTLVE